MEGLDNIMTLMAKTMPEEKLLDDLKESIIAYQIDQNDKNKSNLEFNLILSSTAILTKGKDAMEIIQEMERTKKGRDLLSPKEQ